MSAADMWGYPDDDAVNRDLTGWSIEAEDGGIGKVARANNEAGASWLIVDTGPWIFGKKVMLRVKQREEQKRHKQIYQAQASFCGLHRSSSPQRLVLDKDFLSTLM